MRELPDSEQALARPWRQLLTASIAGALLLAPIVCSVTRTIGAFGVQRLIGLYVARFVLVRLRAPPGGQIDVILLD